jgi:hypothetical protein
MSTIAFHVIELVKSLPLEEQRAVREGLATTGAPKTTPRRQLQRLPDGGYFNPDGIPNDDPVFKVLEDIEAERHREPGPPAPSFD